MNANLIEEVADLTLTTLDGDTVRISDYRGRRLIVFCWGSW